MLSAATDRRCEGGPPLAGQMRLGAQTAAESSEGVVGGLVVQTTGWLFLPVASVRAPAACWCARLVIEPTLTVHVRAANRAMTPPG